MSEIADKVKAIVMDKLNIDDPAKVTEEATFVNDLGADSLDTVELIMDLENTFEIEIPESESTNIKTVGDAIAYIEKAKN
ncbi:MAG: acyl carrier protein [Bacteroidales bacterium]|nr:acyl carrier protein [Bacteroidales bacterium]MBD5177319.1 acyl carrier protein [Bacteroidales bacterium]